MTRISRLNVIFVALGLAGFFTTIAVADTSAPVRSGVSHDLIFQEVDGMVAVEAEHFFKQTITGQRAWHLTSPQSHPDFEDDADPIHLSGAGGGAYLECLPDTRHDHSHKLIKGENFSNEPGKMAILHYKIHFEKAGRFYVWVRAYSTGSEDNGIHVGIDGEWPESGQRMQWCEGKESWRWESRQRTEKEHCGEPYKISLDVKEPGVHEVQFSMREDGFEFDKFLLTTDREFARPDESGPESAVRKGILPKPFEVAGKATGNVHPAAKKESRGPDGKGDVIVSGEQKQWHKVTLTMDGPFAYELDEDPNPFRDYRMTVRFQHESGSPDYEVPGYFAADGNAAESSAHSGTQWRAHLSPDVAGKWNYTVHFRQGKDVALGQDSGGETLAPFDGIKGEFEVSPTNKTGRDLRSKGRLQYVGERYLKFAGTGEYFLKAGADAPETFLGYADFDGTHARKAGVPLKTWEPHLKDWNKGDPTWKDGKGKGMIGAINYLADKGCNVFSFLTYNAGGDGDNVWPFVERDDKFHYDCSKLDQWGIVFDHATSLGHYLHFKMQETENDDDRKGHKAGKGAVPTSLDGGNLGPERKLYCRELIARYGYLLALNWNLGEENTQSTEQQKAMAQWIADLDPYNHLIVVHTFPDQQDKVYRPLMGGQSALTGMSLQNSDIKDTHSQVVKWVRETGKAGKDWVVAFDESGSAAHGQVPDVGYEGFQGKDKDGKKIYLSDEVRKQTLWGTLMGGGAGVEYYFGYKLPQNDLICEDWRSRDQSWDDCKVALDFFRTVPFHKMQPADELIGNEKHDNSRYCLAQKGEIYLIYLPRGGTADLDLTDAEGSFKITWFNPRTGGEEVTGSIPSIEGGKKVNVGKAPRENDLDWVAILRSAH